MNRDRLIRATEAIAKARDDMRGAEAAFEEGDFDFAGKCAQSATAYALIAIAEALVVEAPSEDSL